MPLTDTGSRAPLLEMLNLFDLSGRRVHHIERLAATLVPTTSRWSRPLRVAPAQTVPSRVLLVELTAIRGGLASADVSAGGLARFRSHRNYVLRGCQVTRKNGDRAPQRTPTNVEVNGSDKSNNGLRELRQSRLLGAAQGRVDESRRENPRPGETELAGEGAAYDGSVLRRWVTGPRRVSQISHSRRR